MKKDTVVDIAGRAPAGDVLTELLRRGAQDLIRQAVEAELQELLNQHTTRRTEDGLAGVVRNGYLPARELQTGVGPIKVKILPLLHLLCNSNARLTGATQRSCGAF